MQPKYKKADKYVVFNEDPDLTEIKVELPKCPKPEDIIGYGLQPEEQKFRKPFTPRKLIEIDKNPNIPLHKKAELLKEDPEYYAEEIEFIQQEWDRRLNGVWYYINGKPTYFPGCFYFYLTSWYVDGGLPQYRDRDRKFFIFSEFVENDPNVFGFIYPKHRREGATTKAACWNYEYISRNRDALGGIQSMTDNHAKEVLTKHIVPSWRRLPFWYKPVFEGTTNPGSEISFFAPAQRVTRTNMGTDYVDELQSKLTYQSSAEGGYDGFRLARYHGDEIGKTKTVDVYRRHLIARQCMSVGSNIVGKCIYTSTAGEMTKGGGEQFKKLIEASDYSKRDKNGRTTSGLYVMFLPADEGFPGKIDEFGNSLREEAREFLMNERQQALEDEDYEKLNESTRQFPLKLRDCFRNASDTDNFNMKIIQDQIDKYQFGNTDVTIGNFEWENGQQDGRVVFVPNKNGRWKVSWLHDNPEDSNRYTNIDGMRVPSNTGRFIAAADTFKFNLTKSSKKSLGGGAVFMRRDHSIDTDDKLIEDWDTHKFVATYLFRPPTKDIFCEDILKAVVYYGCRVAPEINVPAVMDYFQRRGYEGYLHYVLDKKTGKFNKNPGYNTGTKEVESIFRAFHQYVEKHGYRIKHDDLLLQLQEIREDMGDYDLFTAAGFCLIADEDENNYYYGSKDEEEKGDDASDYWGEWREY